MPAIPLKLPFGRVFNQSGAAGPRRLLMIGGAIVVTVGAVSAVALHNRSKISVTTIAKTPAADPLPGGPHTTPVYSDLARRADQEKAAKAAALGFSSVAAMPGSETAVAIVRPPLVVSAPADIPRSATVEAGSGNYTTVSPPRPQPNTAMMAQPIQVQARQEGNQTNPYQAAIGSFLAGWGNKAQATEVILTPDDKPRGGEASTADQVDGRSRPVQSASQSGPIPNARSLGGRADAGRVLMPAGRGIYARTVLAASSDQGGPVVIEALSGPIAGNRMTGSFQQRDNRLVVHLDSITLQDGTQQKIDALVTSPDTLETSVASSVDQHYVSRYVLPVAAAFVSGLGQALSQSNSTVVAGPLGGATAFQRLNFSQQLGVAAGAGANQFGAAVVANAPRGPTVTLDANANVGVVFLAPLVIGDR